MRIVISSNIGNKIGLEADYRLLRAYLEELGHTVAGQQFDTPWEGGEQYDLCIWLEVFNSHLVPIARRHYAFLNPEWTKPETIRPIQRHVEKVFAKTRDAERRLREVFNSVFYTGYLAADHFHPDIVRTRQCLHPGGNSGFRNTDAVISAYREYRYWDSRPLPPLTVITRAKGVLCTPTPGVRFIERASDEELIELQNSHLFHLLPSAYEGFGQSLHEAESVGAVILTTAAPPMDELGAPFHVPFVRTRVNHLGLLHEVAAKDIREIVPVMAEQPEHEISKFRLESRSRYARSQRDFRERFLPHVSERPIEVTSKPRIALLGNFRPPHSTENDLLWTLRDMGYPVLSFQEDEDRTEEIVAACSGVALLIYVHTHGWNTPGEYSLDEMIVRLRAKNVKTCSFHLDRYWGLNQNDQREERIGAHAFWRTDCVFTADGGNQTQFKERFVHHVWLPPGVIKRDCYLGERREDLRSEVGFVGAESYHPEHSFRPRLIEFLRGVYGDRFRLFQGYRGKALNALYASIDVVVGDSCFGGADFYWSDRVPETLGRGGFLIHPASCGLSIPGLVTYEPGNLMDLQEKIEYFLLRVEERKNLCTVAQNWVREHETYSTRMTKLLGVMGCQ